MRKFTLKGIDWPEFGTARRGFAPVEHPGHCASFLFKPEYRIVNKKMKILLLSWEINKLIIINSLCILNNIDFEVIYIPIENNLVDTLLQLKQ